MKTSDIDYIGEFVRKSMITDFYVMIGAALIGIGIWYYYGKPDIPFWAMASCLAVGWGSGSLDTGRSMLRFLSHLRSNSSS